MEPFLFKNLAPDNLA
jgi:type IV secretory pathway VirB2 component (pilin)